MDSENSDPRTTTLNRSETYLKDTRGQRRETKNGGSLGDRVKKILKCVPVIYRLHASRMGLGKGNILVLSRNEEFLLMADVSLT